MTVGVIGGRGFVGSGVCAAFQTHGITPVAIQRDNYASLIGARFDVLINANGNSKKYLAAQDPKQEFAASVGSVHSSLVDFHADLYIHLSTIDVYPDHATPANNTEDVPIRAEQLSLYGFHKFLAEGLVQRYAPRWLILRCGGFVGNGLKKNSVYDILNGRPLRVHIDSAYQYLPTTALGEIILQLCHAARPPNGILNVCGRGTIALREILALVPEYQLQYHEGNPPDPERYEVSLEKVSAYVNLPDTVDSVHDFIRRYRTEGSAA